MATFGGVRAFEAFKSLLWLAFYFGYIEGLGEILSSIYPDLTNRGWEAVGKNPGANFYDILLIAIMTASYVLFFVVPYLGVKAWYSELKAKGYKLKNSFINYSLFRIGYSIIFFIISILILIKAFY